MILQRMTEVPDNILMVKAYRNFLRIFHDGKKRLSQSGKARVLKKVYNQSGYSWIYEISKLLVQDIKNRNKTMEYRRLDDYIREVNVRS